jgi:hypothetical protein
LTGLNRSTIKPVKPAGFGFGSTVFKTSKTLETAFKNPKKLQSDSQINIWDILFTHNCQVIGQSHDTSTYGPWQLEEPRILIPCKAFTVACFLVSASYTKVMPFGLTNVPTTFM